MNMSVFFGQERLDFTISSEGDTVYWNQWELKNHLQYLLDGKLYCFINGNKYYMYNVRDGKKDGEYFFFYKNGSTKEEGVYYNGRLIDNKKYKRKKDP